MIVGTSWTEALVRMLFSLRRNVVFQRVAMMLRSWKTYLIATVLAVCSAVVGCIMLSEGLPAKEVRVKPGDDIKKIVAQSPEGTIFLLSAGTYRQQYIEPRNDQQFIGDDGAVLNGAMRLKNWHQKNGLWVHAGLPEPLPQHGECTGNVEVCRFREDLFVNGKVLQRVLDKAQLNPGKWFYKKGTAYLAEDPQDRLVELGVTARAFGGSAKRVLLRNLVVEKYASAAQSGAIDLRHATEWEVKNVTARWNHGIGLYIGPKTRVEGGTYNHNGQMGMGGIGDGSVIDGPEIAYNNYANFKQFWEAGGFKFSYTKGLTVRNACVHHNNGVGMWNDIDNVDTVFEGNRVFDNAGLGIDQEISYAAIIRNNTVARNGKTDDSWLWGSQILIQNSQDVQVYGNTVEVAPGFGNGISIIYQERGKGEFGPYFARNNRVYKNTIRHLGAHGLNGLVADYENEWFRTKSNNLFDENTYIVPDAKVSHWLIYDGYQKWEAVRALGMEKNGRLIERQEKPLDLSCAK